MTNVSKLASNLLATKTSLVAQSGQASGFCIAGADRTFVAADGLRIDGNKLIISSKSVPHPAFVRFGWNDYPLTDLWNKSGLPASPFEIAVKDK
jgi:sialate O-acetylesterase